IISGSLLRGELIKTKFQFSTGMHQGCPDLIIEINSIKRHPKLEQLLIWRKQCMDGLRNRVGRSAGSEKAGNGKVYRYQEKGGKDGNRQKPTSSPSPLNQRG